jgi:molybdopterin-guanine dinucleotide biosynthesis protein A
MQGLILAGGEGSRLAASGVDTPKALVPVGGIPQAVRLVRTLHRLGCSAVTVALRDGVSDAALRAGPYPEGDPPRILRCLTPSSLHTLVEGLRTLPPGPVLCTMVDTVMPLADWAETARQAEHQLADGADALLVVTGYVDDEKPLYVHRDDAGHVTTIGDAPSTPPCVTGGVYVFGPRAREVAAETLAQGHERMRAFLGQLVVSGARVAVQDVSRVIDLDHRRDLDAANQWSALGADGPLFSANRGMDVGAGPSLVSRAGHCVALYRKPAYSPQQHLANDTAIMDAVVERLEEHGWRVTRASEADLEAGLPQRADVYLNMCQGPTASERLCQLEDSGGRCVNSPRSVLSCHRHRLVPLMEASGLAFPRTLIASTAPEELTRPALAAFLRGHDRMWVKRGDVHAERTEDVVLIAADELPATLAEFAVRGISRVALQEHVSGPVIKFYGVADGAFFRWYDSAAGVNGPRPEVDEARLRALAFAAAERLGLHVFGGDAVVPTPDRPVLIDINDWPSFAPFRAEAAQAIARLVHDISYAGVTA